MSWYDPEPNLEPPPEPLFRYCNRCGKRMEEDEGNWAINGEVICDECHEEEERRFSDDGT